MGMISDFVIGKAKAAGKSFAKRHWKALTGIGLIMLIIVILITPIVDFVNAVKTVVNKGMYLASRLSGEPLYDEDALYTWQNGGDEEYTDSILKGILTANAGDEEAQEIFKPIISNSHLFMAPEDILGVFYESATYNKRMFEVFNVDYSYRLWVWDNWGSEDTGDLYYLYDGNKVADSTGQAEYNNLRGTYVGDHGSVGAKSYPSDWVNPSEEELGEDSHGCLSGWYWLLNPEADHASSSMEEFVDKFLTDEEDADKYPVFDISYYDGQKHRPDGWYGQEQRMDIEGEPEDDENGVDIENTHRFRTYWQDIIAMCQLAGLFNYDDWGTEETSQYDPSIAFNDNETDDYYLSDALISTIIGLFEYKFTYLYEPDTADSFVGRVYEEATIEFNFLKAEKGKYQFAYHFIKEQPESVLEEAWSGGEEHYEWVTAYVPECAPKTIQNSWETIEYIYTSTDNVPNYLPEGDTYEPPEGDYCVGRFDIQDPTPFVETVSDLTKDYYYERTTSDAEVASGFGDGDEGEKYVERNNYHWAIEMMQFYTEYLDLLPYAEGQSDIYTELAKDYDERVIRISYEGTQTDEYVEELVKLLAYYETYTVVFPVAEDGEDDGVYPEGWTTDITQARMGTTEFYDIPTDLSGLPFHSYGVTYHGEESTGTDTEDPKPISNDDTDLTEEQNIMYETLVELLVANGYSYVKAKGMAYAFSILYPKYGMVTACGVIANIAHEGSPAQMEYYDGDGTYYNSEGKLRHRDWYGTTKTQQALAGKILSTSAQLEIADTIPTTTAAGLGMCQWSFGRRAALLDQYEADGLFDKGTFTTTDAMISEVKYMLSELEGGYKSTLTAMQGYSNAYAAAMEFQETYERPANISSARGNTGRRLEALITAWMEEGYSDTGT